MKGLLDWLALQGNRTRDHEDPIRISNSVFPG